MRLKLANKINDLNWFFYKRRDNNKVYRFVFNKIELLIQIIEGN